MGDSYQETLDYLYSFVDFSLTKATRYSAEQFDLARMQVLVERLQHPERTYAIIHIAGTKGKGSVAAMCQSVLTSEGYRTGLYTSPHLHDYAERIQIDGHSIPHEELVALIEEIRPVLETIPQITTFEITTALAFLYFSRQKVDVAVIEVGLGGRLDATNVVIPVVSVITSLSYDHMFLLGNTLAEIAGEKCGIIKPGVPVVVSPQQDEALLVIEKIAEQRGAPITLVGRDYLYRDISRSLSGQTMQVWVPGEQPQVDEYIQSGEMLEREPNRLTVPLLGFHQITNAATAYAALQVFAENALPISDAAIRQGFANTNWPGRFEVLRQVPPVVIDCAHNRDSARKLRLALDDYFPGQPVILVFGASEDKDIHGMFVELMPRICEVIATRSYHPRAIEPEKLVEIAHQFGRPARIVPDVADALNEALSIAAGEKPVLATGSIFIAAGAREAWLARTTGSQSE
jgi:dihydrofolate synthase/folylpolyglutamate synthase